MKLRVLGPSGLALTTAAVFLLPAAGERASAYVLLGSSLPLDQRDFRVLNNFTDAASNDNQTPDPNFPGYQGAVMAIWKGCVEWGSGLHGDGHGDPHQPGGLGSGGANFDPSFQGQANDPGDENTFSAISSCSPGVLAYTALSGGGWQIRFCDSAWTFSDGPGTSIGSHKDIQGTAAHEYGHALGLGHSSVGGATMVSGAPGDAVSWRSIEADDIAGAQALYGAAAPTKPLISGLSVSADQLTISGSNFSTANNAVWFTQLATGGSGEPVKVQGLASDGSTILVTVPPEAGPGDVLVQNAGGGHASLSNAYPFQPDPPCPPVPASESVRLGVPPNPAALLGGVTSRPIIGTTWDPVIDHTGFLPFATLDLVLIAALGVNRPTVLGTILFDPGKTPLISASGPGVPFAIPIPNDCKLIGAQPVAQGIALDGLGGLGLTNALDLTIGRF